MAQINTLQGSFKETLQRVKVLTCDKNVVVLKKGRFVSSEETKSRYGTYVSVQGTSLAFC